MIHSNVLNFGLSVAFRLRGRGMWLNFTAFLHFTLLFSNRKVFKWHSLEIISRIHIYLITPKWFQSVFLHFTIFLLIFLLQFKQLLSINTSTERLYLYNNYCCKYLRHYSDCPLSFWTTKKYGCCIKGEQIHCRFVSVNWYRLCIEQLYEYIDIIENNM